MTREELTKELAWPIFANRAIDNNWREMATREEFEEHYRLWLETKSKARDGMTVGYALRDARAALTSLESLGLAIVPVEPTEAMLKTSLGISHATKLPSFESRLDLRPSIWKHMLAASPLRKTDGEGA